MGYTGPLGATGYCYRGSTYATSNSEVCGGFNNWGETEMEVWRLE